MKKVLIFAGLFVVLCFAAGFWTLKDFDKTIRTGLIKAVNEKTGRTLAIDGETKFSFSFSPSVTLTDVKFSNAAWAGEPYMLKAGRMDVKVALLPLLARKIEISSFQLNDASVFLEVSGTGQNNWTFFKEKEAVPVAGDAGDETAAAPVSDSKKDAPALKGFDINSLSFNNIMTVFQDWKNQRTFTGHIDNLTLAADSDGVGVNAAFTVQNTKFVLSASGAPFDVLFEGETPYQFAVKLEGNDVTLAAQGSIEDVFGAGKIGASAMADVSNLPSLAAAAGISMPQINEMNLQARIGGTLANPAIPELKFSLGSENSLIVRIEGAAAGLFPLEAAADVNVSAPDIAGVPGLFAAPLPASSLTMKVSVLDHVYTFSNIAAFSGKSDFKGSAVVDTAPDRLTVSADFVSGVVNLSDLLAKTAQKTDNIVSLTPVPAPRPSPSGKMFSPSPLPFEKLKTADVDVRYTVDKFVGADGTDLGKVVLGAKMQNGVFTLSDFKLAGFIAAQASMNASDGRTASVAADVKIKNLPLSLFMAKKGVSKGTLSGDISLKGAGFSEETIASSLDGKIFLQAKDIRVDSIKLIQLPVFLASSFSDPSKPLNIPCFVINVPVNKGIITSDKRAAMESDVISLQADGSINLSKETLNVDLKMSPNTDGILEAVINNVFFSGSLSSPVLTLDKDKSMERAFSIGLAFLSGGKKAAKELIQQDVLKNVCATALAGK